MMDSTASVRRRIAWGALGVALAWFVLRAWAQIGEHEPGLGMTVFLLGMLVTLGAFAYANGRIAHREAWWLAAPIAVLALDITLYANPAVSFFGTLATCALLLMFVAHLLSDRVRLRNVFLGPLVLLELTLRGSGAVAETISGRVGGDGARRIRGIAAGALIAVPFLIMFVVAFASASSTFDAFFDSVFGRFHVRNVEAVLEWTLHVIVALLAGGFVAGLALFPAQESRPIAVHVPVATTATFFVLLDALFALFLVFQLPEMFAGDAWMRAHGFTYAELARQGFDALLFASTLALGTVLLWFLVTRTAADRVAHRMERIATTVFIACTTLVAASALQRIVRYASAYGLTLPRAYAAVAVVVIVVAFALLLVALWRGHALAVLLRRLVILAIVAVTLTLSFPMEYTVASWNVLRELSGRAHRPFDGRYILRMSPDALPALRGPDNNLKQQMQHACAEYAAEQSWQSHHFFAARACAKLTP